MTPDQIYQLLLGLVTLFGGIWIRRLQSDIRDLEEDVDRIRDEYQRRDDALRDYALISDNIKDIKNTLNRILDKLDKRQTGHEGQTETASAPCDFNTTRSAVCSSHRSIAVHTAFTAAATGQQTT
jgi:hypothetical protein